MNVNASFSGSISYSYPRHTHCSFPCMDRFSKEVSPMLWSFKPPTFVLKDESKREHLFPADSRILNLLLMKLLSDVEHKMGRLANIYSQRNLPGPQTGRVKKCFSIPDADHLAHCCACWRRCLDWSEICRVAPGFG